MSESDNPLHERNRLVTHIGVRKRHGPSWVTGRETSKQHKISLINFPLTATNIYLAVNVNLPEIQLTR